jgi:hypothetical protein
MKKEWTILAGLVAFFLVAYSLPLTDPRIQAAILEAFKMLQWYARNHTLACVLPAMFIAGGIATFLSKEAVLRHLGPKANKVEAYSVASVSGTVLAVCSCSVLPMFAGIYRAGAGLGPAATFLYSGPAINVMAIFLTARVLGIRLGLARIIGAVVFSIVVGLLMAAIFQRGEEARAKATMQLPDPPPSRRTLWQTCLYFLSMIGFLIFSDWSNPSTTLLQVADGATAVLADHSAVRLPGGVPLEVAVLQDTRGDMLVQLAQPLADLKAGTKFTLAKAAVVATAENTPENYAWVAQVYHHRWYCAAACAAALLIMLWRWFRREELVEWLGNTWDFAKSIVPLLFGGVLITGFVAELLPAEQVARWVGGNSLQANFVSSLIGAMWYFATLTEIPILQALMDLGMGQGPALALLLAGPALSIPSIVVMHSYIGLRKTFVFVSLVVVLSTLAGMGYGYIVGDSVSHIAQGLAPVTAAF